MALDKYNTGLLSVANGSDEVTIDGALLQTWGAQEDDILLIDGFNAVYLSEVTGQETVTLLYPWSGATQEAVAYTIMANPLNRLNASGLSRMANSIRDLLAGIAGQPPAYRVLGSAPDDNIGEQDQIAFKVSGGNIICWAKDGGSYGTPLSLATAYADGAGILDIALNELLTFGVVADAVNNWKMSNAAAAGVPRLEVVGDDTNISARYATKGIGSHIWEINAIDELELSATYLRPASNDGLALGDATHGFSDADFAAGAVLRFNNAYTVTHSAGLLTASHAFTAGGIMTAAAFVPQSSAEPSNGMYLPAANTLGWAINSIAELHLNSTELYPVSDLGQSLGTASKRFDKLNNIDISSAANLFNAIKQDATETATGVVELATNAEVQAGADTVRAVTPAGLRAALREKLTAARTYYVRTDGSDANNGLANNAGGAFLTIQKALDVVFGTLDLGGNNVTIQVGAGTYTGTISVNAPQVGKGTITLLGDAATPSNVFLNVTGTAIAASNYASLSVSGVKIAATLYGITAATLGSVNITGPVEFAACGSGHMRALTGGQISCSGVAYTISGSAPYHVRADAGLGFINLFSSTATLTGSPVFSSGFASADRLSIVSAGSFSSSGSTGSSSKRYSVSLNGVVYTGGGGANFFPGDTAGTTATGGQYA